MITLYQDSCNRLGYPAVKFSKKFQGKGHANPVERKYLEWDGTAIIIDGYPLFLNLIFLNIYCQYTFRFLGTAL